MEAYHFTILGLILDIIGGFLVSVEAIKLENLKVLRERFFSPIHSVTLPHQIVFVKHETPETKSSGRWLLIYFGLHLLSGAIVCATVFLGINSFFNGSPTIWQSLLWEWYWNQPGTLILLSSLLIIPIGCWFALIILFELGEMVHVALIWGTEIPIRLLDWVVTRTPTGTVGIIGFLLLFAGFLLQMLGTYLGSINTVTPQNTSMDLH